MPPQVEARKASDPRAAMEGLGLGAEDGSQARGLRSPETGEPMRGPWGRCLGCQARLVYLITFMVVAASATRPRG